MVSNSPIPMIAVWMVTYNHELFIEKAIESIMMQATRFSYKLLIGDDCSTDGTREICERLKTKYPSKIELFVHKSNIGANANGIFMYERCIESGAKYVALLEGDDYWTDPLKLQKQVDFLEANPKYAGSFHNTNKLDETKLDSDLEPWRSYEKEIFTIADTITTTSLFHTSSFLFKTSSLVIPEWLENLQSADMALFSIIASKGPLYRVEDTMSVYRKNEAGVTSTISWRNYHKNRITLFQHLKSYCGPLAGKEIDEITNYHKLELKEIKKRLIKKKITGFIKRLSLK